MMCSGLILWLVESKYTKLPLRMLTAPTLKRISPALMRSKSTSRSSVLRNGAVSYQLVASTVPGAAR